MKVKELDHFNYYLGVQTEKKEDGSYLLNQTQEFLQILEFVQMKESIPVGTLMETNYLKHRNDEPSKQHREAIGRLLYITFKHPDVT